LTSRTLRQAVWDIREVGYSLEQMARSLVESGEYHQSAGATSRIPPTHPPDNSPKVVAAVVDVETTGISPDSDKIIEFDICLFEYDRPERANLDPERELMPVAGGAGKTEGVECMVVRWATALPPVTRTRSSMAAIPRKPSRGGVSSPRPSSKNGVRGTEAYRF
jgi:hypothetical protein